MTTNAEPNHTPLDSDVVIIGYGPTGSVLSILLAQYGYRVVVLERYPSTYPLPRAVHFDGEVARVFQACGIGDQLPLISDTSGVYEWQNAQRQTLLRFPASTNSGMGWPGGNMFTQPALEDALAQRAETLSNLTVLRAHDATDIAQSDEFVTVTHTGGSTSARYLVGCDGARSLTRTLLGSPVTDLGFFYDWLICDVILNNQRTYDPQNLQVCDPHRPTTVVSGGPGRRRWEFMALPGESVDELNTEEATWQLLSEWDVNPHNATLERHTVYTFQARWVEQWRSGRVFLAGDAAHQMPPFAGQGMCSGVRDAANLAFKLHAVLSGSAPDTVLDTYEVERKPHVKSSIEVSMMLGGVICVPDPEAAAARDTAMIAQLEAKGSSPMPPGPIVAEGLFRSGDPMAGHLFPQGRVTLGTVSDRLDDVIGVGWRVIAVVGTDLTIEPRLAAWFEGIGGSVHAIGADGELVDTEGVYMPWFERNQLRAVLQRPDFHIFGSTGADGTVNALVASLECQFEGSGVDKARLRANQ